MNVLERVQRAFDKLHHRSAAVHLTQQQQQQYQRFDSSVAGLTSSLQHDVDAMTTSSPRGRTAGRAAHRTDVFCSDDEDEDVELRRSRSNDVDRVTNGLTSATAAAAAGDKRCDVCSCSSSTSTTGCRNSAVPRWNQRCCRVNNVDDSAVTSAAGNVIGRPRCDVSDADEEDFDVGSIVDVLSSRLGVRTVQRQPSPELNSWNGTLPSVKSPVLGRRCDAAGRCGAARAAGTGSSPGTCGSGSGSSGYGSCPGSPRDSSWTCRSAFRSSTAVGWSSPVHQRRLSSRTSSPRTSARSSLTTSDQSPARSCRQLTGSCSSPLSSVVDDVYRPPNYAHGLLNNMANHLAAGQLCDVVLTSGQHRIPAHRLVLCAASERLAAILSPDVVDAAPTEVQLKDVEPEALRDVINYIYTGRLALRGSSVEAVLSLATRWKLDEVCLACCSYLGAHLNPVNCLSVRRFAVANDCSGLHAITNSYILDNFVDVLSLAGDEFARLSSVDDVIALLSSDDLNVPEERTVFEAVLTWLKYDLTTRRKFAVRLLSLVKLPLLSPQFLTDHVMSERLLKDDDACLDMVVEALKFHLLPDRRHSLHSPRTRPRKSYVGRLFAVGGDDTTGAANVESYDPRTDSWQVVADTTQSRLQFAVATIDNRLYVVGGRDGLRTLNVVEVFDPVTRRWSAAAGMKTHRHGLGVAVLEGPLYAVGGHDGWSYLSSVERYDADTRQWTYVAQMATPRSTLGVAVVGGKLYAVGGRDGSSCLATVECYSPHTDSWSSCAPMTRCRAGVGVTALNGLLYAVGGHETISPATSTCASSRLDCVERYDPRSDCWTLITPVGCPVDAVGVAVLGDRLFVVGGTDGQRYMHDVYSYDTLTNEWTQVASMSRGRVGPCVVALKDYS